VAVPPSSPRIYYTPQLVDAALAAEPQLKVLRQESASAQAAADLTRRQRLPDVSVGLEARQYSGDGGFREGTATVSFSLPWLNKGRTTTTGGATSSEAGERPRRDRTTRSPSARSCTTTSSTSTPPAARRCSTATS
jgi:hypothetical protein